MWRASGGRSNAALESPLSYELECVGWELAGELCRQDNLGMAVAAYDKKSLPKAWSTLNTSHDRIKKVHSTGLGWTGLRVGLKMASVFIWLRGG